MTRPFLTTRKNFSAERNCAFSLCLKNSCFLLQVWFLSRIFKELTLESKMVQAVFICGQIPLGAPRVGSNGKGRISGLHWVWLQPPIPPMSPLQLGRLRLQ